MHVAGQVPAGSPACDSSCTENILCSENTSRYQVALPQPYRKVFKRSWLCQRPAVPDGSGESALPNTGAHNPPSPAPTGLVPLPPVLALPSPCGFTQRHRHRTHQLLHLQAAGRSGSHIWKHTLPRGKRSRRPSHPILPHTGSLMPTGSNTRSLSQHSFSIRETSCKSVLSDTQANLS